jgi:FkbM family methyltransferase
MISYAQNFEDVILNRIFADQPSGFYIDVGAMDPVEGSVTKTFYDRGWHGVNIEPELRFYDKLAAERERDTNLNLALGEAPEVRLFYSFEDQGISTFNERFRDYFMERGHRWREVACSVTTLAEVCRAHCTGPIDFLKIDAEGWEGAILRGGDWVHFRPRILLIEATEPFSHTPTWPDWEQYLVGECGYVFVYFDGLNRFYVRGEDRELECRFEYPPNVLDAFTPYAVVEAKECAAKAEERALQLRAALERLEAELPILREAELRCRSKGEQLKAVLRRQGARLRALADEKRAVSSINENLREQAELLQEKLALVERELLDTRLWVGRLSEKLAATKVR